jgi:hypothetical protein
VSNVLSQEKRQQVIALGRLGWPLWRIQQKTGIRRETAGAYLKAAGIAIRAPGGWGRRGPAKPANEVSPEDVPSWEKVRDLEPLAETPRAANTPQRVG